MTGFSTSSWSLPTAKIITPDQVQRILTRAKEISQRDYVFFATAINTGLRLCEVLHIEKDDLQGGKLLVIRRKKKVLLPAPIDIVPALVPVLNEWSSRVECGFIFPGRAAPCWIEHLKGPREQICCGGHASKRDLQRKWLALLRELGIHVHGRGIHSSRHFAITEFYRKYRDLRAAQLFAGHSSSTITERYASVVDMKEKIEGMAVML